MAGGLIGGGIWRDEFGQAKNGGVIARLALHFINTFPFGLFVGRWFCSRQSDFNFQTIE